MNDDEVIFEEIIGDNIPELMKEDLMNHQVNITKILKE